MSPSTPMKPPYSAPGPPWPPPPLSKEASSPLLKGSPRRRPRRRCSKGRSLPSRHRRRRSSHRHRRRPRSRRQAPSPPAPSIAGVSVGPSPLCAPVPPSPPPVCLPPRPDSDSCQNGLSTLTLPLTPFHAPAPPVEVPPAPPPPPAAMSRPASENDERAAAAAPAFFERRRAAPSAASVAAAVEFAALPDDKCQCRTGGHREPRGKPGAVAAGCAEAAATARAADVERQRGHKGGHRERVRVARRFVGLRAEPGSADRFRFARGRRRRERQRPRGDSAHRTAHHESESRSRSRNPTQPTPLVPSRKRGRVPHRVAYRQAVNRS